MTRERMSNKVLCGLQTDLLRTDNGAAGNKGFAIAGGDE